MDRFTEEFFSQKSNSSGLSNKFASEDALKVIKQNRLKEREILGREPIDLDESAKDPRPLYEQLEERRKIVEGEFAEKAKLSNLVHRLDSDECAFIRKFEENKKRKKLEIETAERKKLREFKEAVNGIASENVKISAQELFMTSSSSHSGSNKKQDSRDDRPSAIIDKPLREVQRNILKKLIVKNSQKKSDKNGI